MNKKLSQTLRKQNVLFPALVLAIAGLGSSGVQAFEFGGDEWSASVDTTVSYGFSVRATDSKDEDVGKATNNPATFLLPYEQQVAQVGRWSNNDDDPNINYPDAGDLITNTAKITAEMDITWRNFGGFFRASAFYDFENAGKDFLSDEADTRVGSDIRLLDAYIWGDHEMGDRYLSWRLGRQVVSWGESTFIQGGLNVINPVDVSKLRLAGSELKEAFEGVNMLWATMDLTESLSIEGLYMFEYREIIPDPAGTYFSESDIATPGASYAMLGFGTYPQPVINPDLYDPACLQGDLSASDQTISPTGITYGCLLAVPRSASDYASDSGQYGAALRWFAENLNSTEFGFYYLRYHSRLPVISGYALQAVPPPFTSASYYTEYPEDIDLYGISFNTTVGTWSLGGEVSYRPNLPLQIDDVEILFAALTPLNPLIPAPVNRYKSQLGQFLYDPNDPNWADIQGYHEHKSWQAQATLTKLFGPGNFLHANQIAFVTEAGINHVADLHDPSELRYNGPGTDTGGGADVFSGDFNNPVTEVSGWPDDTSWGYRMLMRADYNNALGAWTVSPRIAWAHDVDGTTPGPGGSFIDGRKTVTVGLGFNLLNEWIIDIAYTDFMGGGKYNLLRNRDFFAASIRYSF
jgi:hypothetical protein